MTCIAVFYVQPKAAAPWLLSDSPHGPRSPRTRSRSEAMSGPVISTETHSTPDGLPVMDRQAFHEAMLLARREALIGTAKHLRNMRRSKAASTCEAELRAVVNACLSMGER